MNSQRVIASRNDATQTHIKMNTFISCIGESDGRYFESCSHLCRRDGHSAQSQVAESTTRRGSPQRACVRSARHFVACQQRETQRESDRTKDKANVNRQNPSHCAFFHTHTHEDTNKQTQEGTVRTNDNRASKTHRDPHAPHIKSRMCTSKCMDQVCITCWASDQISGMPRVRFDGFSSPHER